MKRSDMLDYMIKFNDSTPEYVSDYHRFDMLLSRMERLGMLPPKIELGDSGMINTIEILNYTELDYTVKWEDENEEE